jgi:predicted phage tail protein
VKNSLHLFALAAALAAPLAAQGQCYNPNFGVSIGSGDDTVLAGQTLPFAFPFNGATYNMIYPCTNGFVYLSNTGSAAPTASLCCAGTTTNLLAATSPMISPWWSDLNCIAGQGDVKVDSNANGVTVTWDNAVEYANTVQFDLQLQLLPSGQMIFFFGNTMQVRATAAKLTGMSPGAGSVLPTASNYSLAASAPFLVGNTNYQAFSTGGFNLAGKALSFLPTGPNQYLVQGLNCASSHTSYGDGCVKEFTSFYENFSTGGLDLAGSSMTMLNTGVGYAVLGGIATFMPPSATAATLALTDDSEALQALTIPFPYQGGVAASLAICSNGYVSVASGNGTGYTPVVTTMLANPQTGWYAWHDYNVTLAGSGQVKFEEIGTTAYITWDGVWDYGGASSANANTWQMQFDCATGNVSWVFVSQSGLGNGHLVGYSPAGASLDPGNLDISASLAASFSTQGRDNPPLTLSAAPVPALGASVVYTANNVVTGTILGAHVISFGGLTPGLDLAPLGAPGCKQYVNSAFGTSILVFGVPPTMSITINIPNASYVLGYDIFNQFTTLSPGLNALGLATSNGIRSNIQAF